ncbi:MAG: peptidoglycan DD-metalloendopeptidase family protein [Alphaproteobacteria bacterium]|nr:peptidoglycan DD-metalloendopeptidase family protein [Alphaproteobacteria bacterium]
MLKICKLIIIIIALSAIETKSNAVLSQNDLIAISERLRLNELELQNLEIYKNLLQAQKKQREKQLSAYKATISRNIVSLYKLSTASLKLLLYNEQSKRDALISYSFFTYYTKYIEDEIEKIKEYIVLIQKNNAESQKIEKKILYTNQAIKKNTEILRDFLKNSNHNLAEAQELKDSNERLIKESSSLANLIQNLNKKHYTKNELASDNKVLAERGNFIAPSAGFLESPFKKSPNRLYKNGIVLLNLPNSQVVAPFDGEILFIDDFEKFNKVIIIKHSSSIYSVISGNVSPLVKQQQLVKKHEPIALSGKNLTPIYFEIKYDNKSEDPVMWFEKREKP